MKPVLAPCVFRLASFFIVFMTLMSCSGKKELSSVFLLDKGWMIQSSQKTSMKGEELSMTSDNISGWYSAEVPSTVFGCLTKYGVYSDVLFGKNLEKVNPADFQCSWWYRKSFSTVNNESTAYYLDFDGIIFSANIWLNGRQIASADTLKGTFRQFSINVSDIIRKDGENVLAVEVFPPRAGDLTVGFVDWNPEAPDRGMGIWREVRLRSSGEVSLRYPFVVTLLDTASLKKASLTVSCEAINNSGSKISGYLDVNIDSLVSLKKKITLAPGERKLINFTSSDNPELNIENPRIWWTHDLGRPELYDLKIAFVNSEGVSDRVDTKFGVRDISTYTYTKYGREHKGFKLNGRKILVKFAMSPTG